MKTWKALLLGLFLGTLSIGCTGAGPSSDGSTQESTITEPVPEADDTPPADPGNPTDAELSGPQPPG